MDEEGLQQETYQGMGAQNTILLDDLKEGFRGGLKDNVAIVWIVIGLAVLGLWFFPMIEQVLVGFLERRRKKREAHIRVFDQKDDRVQEARERQQRRMDEMVEESKIAKKKMEREREQNKKDSMDPAVPKKFFFQSNDDLPRPPTSGLPSYRPSNSMRNQGRRRGG
uniref:Selenoprotein S n=1 Tax=Paramoeba aestuarina TaxID=180227 RepID=A0A6U2XWW2_9EUKA|mmetsp:Transcript_19931/g.31248  ORF Transcript_19931/g.31248 Transcript_19931/m.31248 type:complete len:166 (+) Transcript_19931:105-602(+)